MEYILKSEQEMRQFAQDYGRHLKGGEIIELIGDVGAGKTTFTKGLALGLGVQEIVQSPSYTIAAQYSGSEGRRLHHYDLYRLVDPGVVSYDIAESLSDLTVVMVIEWAQNVHSILPNHRTTISITSIGENERQVVITRG